MSLLTVEEFDNVSHFPGKLTRKQKKQFRKNNNNSLKLKNVFPKTINQEKAFDLYNKDYNLLLHGLAGTGKTYISLYLALSDIINGYTDHTNLTLVRSVVPTRDMGFLPGTEKEKSKVYEAPYMNICNDIFGRGDAYDILKGKNIIKFVTTSYIRGITLDDSIVLVDEAQNLNFHELDSIITRLGDNSRIMFCGDFRQSDLIRDDERKGLLTFMRILATIDEFKTIEFVEDDIVRSKLVKEYIISKVRQGIV
jgi:phosphate starvation-inducible protein PhoH|tara:strand:+ start:5599 stop:6354 length:756 start_codon:yes stop_codon:yes gene_type:complete